MASENRRPGQDTGPERAAIASDGAAPELLKDIENERDARRAYATVQQRLSVYRAKGVEVPESLLRMERVLAFECTAESQGR